MSTDPKESPEALLAALRQDVEDDEHLAKLEAMTDAELDAELAKAGITPEKSAELDARARAAADALVTPAKVVELPKKKRTSRMTYVMAGAGGALALAASVVIYLTATGVIDFGPEPSPTGATQSEALREEATKACDRHDWSLCLKKLDEARDIDPQGDKTQVVRDLRERATKGH